MYELLFLMAKAYWKRNLPIRYNLYLKQGILDSELERVVTRAKEWMADLVLEQGMSELEAREIVLPATIYPPTEDSYSYSD